MKRNFFSIFVIFTLLTTTVYASRLDYIFQNFFGKSVFSNQNDSITYRDTIGHWCDDSAKKLYRDGIFTGIKIGKNYYFMPDEYITRGEFLLYLDAVVEVPAAKTTFLPFTDKSSIPKWLLPTVTSMYEKGYIKGNMEKRNLYFNYDEKISRLECAIILNNAMEFKNVSHSVKYYDDYLIPSYAVTAVKNVTDHGIMQGYEDGSFRPYIKINRAMLADILCKANEYYNKR